MSLNFQINYTHKMTRVRLNGSHRMSYFQFHSKKWQALTERFLCVTLYNPLFPLWLTSYCV